MKTLEFAVDERNEGLFESRLERLMAGCEAHGLVCEIEHLDTYTRDLIKEVRGKEVSRETIEFKKYQLQWEEPDTERYVYVGVLREVGNSNLLDIAPHFQTEYLDNLEYDIGIPDEIYSVELECEHCLSGRKCMRTHVIFDLEEDVFFQVAKGCLTGYVYFTYSRNIEYEFDSLNVYDEREEGQSSGVRRITTYEDLDLLAKHALTHYLAQEEKEYISRSTAVYKKTKSTIEVVTGAIRKNDPISQEAEEVYPLFIDYLVTMQGAEQKNMEVMVEENSVPDFKQGYIVYLAYKYFNDQEKIQREYVKRELTEKSEYLGEIGERLEVEVEFYNEVSFDTQFGVKTLYFFKTSKSDVIVWGTQAYVDVDEGDKVLLRGRVKEHREYNGTQQTFVSHVKLKEIKN